MSSPQDMHRLSDYNLESAISAAGDVLRVHPWCKSRAHARISGYSPKSAESEGLNGVSSSALSNELAIGDSRNEYRKSRRVGSARGDDGARDPRFRKNSGEEWLSSALDS